MSESSARQLAVAALQAAGEGAAILRAPDGRPLHAYCLLTGDGADCRVTVYLEQAGGGRTAVLAGDLVWLGAPGAEAKAPAELPVLVAQGAALAAPPAPAHVPWSGLLDSAGEPASATASASSAGEPERSDAETPEPRPESGPERAPEPPVPAGEPEPEPDVVGFKLYPEPATPVGAFPAHEIKVLVTPLSEEPAAEPEPELPATLTVPMQPRHPLAPRAGGNVRLDFRAGSLTLTLRGLPSPAALGREAATDRPYNMYRAYLVSQRTGARQPLGPLARVWGDNFKLETEGSLPLTRHDAVLVTAEDRSATAPAPGAPQVLLGSYGT